MKYNKTSHCALTKTKKKYIYVYFFFFNKPKIIEKLKPVCILNKKQLQTKKKNVNLQKNFKKA